MNEILFTCQMVCDLSPVNKALWQHLTAIFHLNFPFQNKRPIPERSVKIPPTATGRQKRNEAACVLLIHSHLGQELLITPEKHLNSHSSLSFWARQHSKTA